MVLNLSNLVLKKYGKSFFKMCGNPAQSTEFFSLPKKFLGVCFCCKLNQYCTDIKFLEKKVYSQFLKRYEFVTMVHKGVNFRTSLCFISSLEAKFEGWRDTKYIFKAKEYVLL